MAIESGKGPQSEEKEELLPSLIRIVSFCVATAGATFVSYPQPFMAPTATVSFELPDRVHVFTRDDLQLVAAFTVLVASAAFYLAKNRPKGD